MVQQGFFSGSASKEQRIAGNLGPSTPIRGEYGLGKLNKNQGVGYPANVIPKKGFTIKDVYDTPKGLVKKPFFSGDVKVATTGNLPSDYTRTEDDVNFDNDALLAAALYSDSTSGGEFAAQTIIFDQEVVNQDLYVTLSGPTMNNFMNYYIEMEEVKMKDPEIAVVNYNAALLHGE